MKKETLIFWLHLILIILAWTSPFWISWKIILLFIGMNYLQIIFFKACVLTLVQFKENGKGMTMYTFILEKIRQNKDFLKIPVIVFSNLSEDKDIKRATKLGISQFMVKSNFTLDELSKKVKELIGS